MDRIYNNWFFLTVPIAIVILTVIVLTISPIISGSLPGGRDWKTLNCKIYADVANKQREELKDKGTNDISTIELELLPLLNLKDLCYRKKAMYALEHASLVIDAVFGSVNAFLFIMYKKNTILKFNGIISLIALITGIISSILTLFYVIYSSYIFNNDIAFKDDEDISKIPKLEDCGAFAKLEGGRYKCYFYNENDEDSFYIKYKDLGKKQYNFNKEYNSEYINTNSEIYKCTVDNNNLYQFCHNIYYDYYYYYYYNYYYNGKLCEYLYYNKYREDNSNKKIYEKWLTSIIFSCLIILFNIFIAIYGFLLFLKKDT